MLQLSGQVEDCHESTADRTAAAGAAALNLKEFLTSGVARVQKGSEQY
ncbi:hypothetical protein ACN22W_19335 [Burkholderia theae]